MPTKILGLITNMCRCGCGNDGGVGDCCFGGGAMRAAADKVVNVI